MNVYYSLGIHEKPLLAVSKAPEQGLFQQFVRPQQLLEGRVRTIQHHNDT